MRHFTKRSLKVGNCYATCEALFHLLGGKASGYHPMIVKHNGKTHWFLRFENSWTPAIIIDPTRRQFGTEAVAYSKARGCGFLTKKPSKAARRMMKLMVYKEPVNEH